MLWWFAVKKGAAVAWAWLKKNWMWLLLPVGVAVYFLGRSQGGVTVVNKREESDAADAFQEKVEGEKQEEQAELKAERDSKVEEVVRQNQEALDALDDEQREKANELMEDPEALNSYLLDVGRRVRG